MKPHDIILTLIHVPCMCFKNASATAEERKTTPATGGRDNAFVNTVPSLADNVIDALRDRNVFPDEHYQLTAIPHFLN